MYPVQRFKWRVSNETEQEKYREVPEVGESRSGPQKANQGIRAR